MRFIRWHLLREAEHEAQVAVHVHDAKPHELWVDLASQLVGVHEWRIWMV
jgi:hypothetical protein